MELSFKGAGGSTFDLCNGQHVRFDPTSACAHRVIELGQQEDCNQVSTRCLANTFRASPGTQHYVAFFPLQRTSAAPWENTEAKKVNERKGTDPKPNLEAPTLQVTSQTLPFVSVALQWFSARPASWRWISAFLCRAFLPRKGQRVRMKAHYGTLAATC